MNWKHLTSVGDLENAISASDLGTVVLFKHSTRCAVSRMALKMFEQGWDESLSDVSAYYLDLLENRPVSAAIAEKLDIEHQSPQMLILQNGQVVHHSNHHAIDVNTLKNYL
jgi:bacillithiol system protein YtxJ